MSLTEALRERARRKAAWLDRAAGLLAADERVAALWLFGSEARGTADGLSDIDLFVAICDPAESELDRVRDWLPRLGELVRAREDPYNDPEAGRYFEAVYASHLLPIVADTYWQPASRALLGNDTRVLVDKVGLPRAEPPQPTYQLIPSVRDSRRYLPPAEPAARLREEIEMFWSDVPIVAKHQARRWGGTDDEIGAIWARVDDIARHLGQPAARRGGLRALVAEMERLVRLPEAIAFGDLKPADADDWLSVSEELIRQGWPPADA